MFEWFAEFSKVLVTGPQRSGTRICTQMIAYDTGYEYIDEADIQVDSLYRLDGYFRHRQRFVVQCPALCRYIHMFGEEDTAIVFMRRDVQDIVASQRRIGWLSEKVELARYDRFDGVIAEIKYQFWKESQKEQIEHSFEVEYESLVEHPLWIPKAKRDNFGPAQVAIRNKSFVNPSAYPRPRLGLLYHEIEKSDRAVLVKRGPAKLLNATGQLIWSLCDGTRTQQDVLQEIRGRFEDVDEEVLAHDVDEFINDLVVGGFLWLSLNMEASMK